MFGFSIGKLLVLAAIIAAVWYGFKFVGQIRNSPQEPSGPDNGAEDMDKCPECGTFVPVSAARHCGRAECRYPE
jgi:hypothetical protein